MRVVDLKKESVFIEQYILLRNSYADLLLTSLVDREDTEQWLAREDVEIRGLAEGNVLLCAVILYLGKGGEVAFFAKEKNKGFGSKLLKLAEDIARRHSIKSIWGWVLKENVIAQRVFEKSGFVRVGKESREFKGNNVSGFRYIKELAPNCYDR